MLVIAIERSLLMKQVSIEKEREDVYTFVLDTNLGWRSTGPGDLRRKGRSVCDGCLVGRHERDVGA